jgi:DNA-binding CsgD family transcriptional regulator
MVALVHFLSFPGGGAGFALFAVAFELGRIGTRSALLLAAASPVAWMLLLALPPHAISLASPALYGPAIGMLWTAVTGYAFSRIRWGPENPPPSTKRRAEAGEDLMALLSPREKEIAAFVAAGLDNAAIAKRLYISPVTVKSHVAHIMSKTGTSTRASLVAQIHQSHQPRGDS